MSVKIIRENALESLFNAGLVLRKLRLERVYSLKYSHRGTQIVVKSKTKG